MVLIEGVADDVLTALFALFVLVILIVAWLSTNVREYNFSTNLLVIERRSRRLYTTNGSLNGSLNLRLSQSPTTTTTTVPTVSVTTTTTTTVDSATGSLLINNPLNTVNHHDDHANTSNIELTEMVEQALVDNLFENDFFSTHHHHHHHHPANLLGSTNVSADPMANQVLAAGGGLNIGVASGNGHASSEMTSRGLNESTVSTSSSLMNDSMTTTTTREMDPINDNSPLSNSQPSSPVVAVASSTSNELINILVRFVNEKEMRIQAKPNDTIHFLKKTYFNQELSNNKIVRFIYQGQFLSDKNTIQFYNIKDKTTIHCHITTKQTTSSSSSSSTVPPPTSSSSDAAANELRHRVVVGDSTTTSVTANSDSMPPENMQQQQQTVGGQQQQQQSLQQTAASATTLPAGQSTNGSSANLRTIISIDLNSLLLPLFAVVLSTFWYFRIHFKHFFSPLSTLILVIFTFLYALFLTNNIHATSTLIANNFWLRSQLFLRSQQAAAAVGHGSTGHHRSGRSNSGTNQRSPF